jgi:AraC-like DNA-binding protein
VQAGGERRAAGAGSFLLLPAGAPHAYGADEAEPWSVQWIHFRGRAAAAFMSWARGSGAETVLPTDPIWAEKLDFSPVYEVLEQDYTRTSLLVAAARLRSLLTKLPGARDRGGASSAPEVVARALAWMRRNPGERLRPVRMAREAGWSETHFRGVFKAATGYPPLEYFLRLKVQRACQLLDTTELRIGEVAAALGWSDAFYFSRQFRRITGQSPRGYRKVVKS